MNLDELRAAQSKERQTDSLQHLRESFYEEAAEYIGELQDERRCAADAAEDPFASSEVRQLTDEIETAREVVEAIYERRLGKLVKSASLAAANIPTDEDGLTIEERALFEDLVERIEENKSRVLDVLDNGGDDDPPAAETDEHEPDAAAPDRSTGTAPERAPGDDPERDTIASEEAASVTGPPEDDRDVTAPDDSPEGREPVVTDDSGTAANGGPIEDAAAAMGGADSHDDGRTNDSRAVGTDGSGAVGTDGTSPSERTPTDDAPANETDPARDSVDRTTVRVTENVEQFYGLDDREYDLDEEDVVTLPETNAEPLLQRGVAERLE